MILRFLTLDVTGPPPTRRSLRSKCVEKIVMYINILRTTSIALRQYSQTRARMKMNYFKATDRVVRKVFRCEREDVFGSLRKLSNLERYQLCVISGFRLDMNEIVDFLGCYTALERRWVPTFRELLLVPFS